MVWKYLEKVIIKDEAPILITGVNNPQGIGATTALAFAREGAKLVLVYKKVNRPFDKDKTDKNGKQLKE